MSSKEFRKYGKELIDWIADYYDYIESYPVQSVVSPGEIRAALPDAAPETAEPFEDWIQDVEKIILPGLTHWQSPSFFGYFPCNSSGPAILGDLLSSGLNVQGMMWSTSPACTEVETHVLDWLVDMLDLPTHFKSSSAGGGVIQDTASSATLCAMLAARFRMEQRKGAVGSSDVEARSGEAAYRFVAYASEEAHSSVEKGLRIIGISTERLRKIATDGSFAMNVTELRAAMQSDREAGLVPFFVSATVGTTSSNAMDPLDKIGDVCQEFNTWLHVDAAMSGTAAICPEFRWIHKGLESADSYCFNPHKWMFTNFDCDCFYVANRSDLTGALSILPEYLKNDATASEAVFDYRDWQIPLGRRFRALKLWFVIRQYGIQGLQYHLRRHVKLAQTFGQWVEEDPQFEILAPYPLALVCFAHKAGDEFTNRLLETVNRTGKIFATHTTLRGRFAIRMSIAQTYTELRHVERAWKLFQETSRSLQAARPENA